MSSSATYFDGMGRKVQAKNDIERNRGPGHHYGYNSRRFNKPGDKPKSDQGLILRNQICRQPLTILPLQPITRTL